MGRYIKNLIRFKFQVLCFVLLLLPVAVSAQSLQFASPKTSYRVGDNFSVSLSIDTNGRSINTISGTIVVPPDLLSISDVRSGNSIISLWVERPVANNAAGRISFSGGVPGGFNGSDGPLLRFNARALREGAANIDVEFIIVLLNDGKGTQVEGVNANSLRINILPPAPKPAPTQPEPIEEPQKEEKEDEVYALPADDVPPEQFAPIVSRHPTIADNKYFVSFSAVDKDSGIAYYEIREEPMFVSFITYAFSTDWKRVEREVPHVLDGQLWLNRIRVRAYDGAGNFTEGSTTKPMHMSLFWVLVGILIVAAIAVTNVIVKKQDDRKFKKVPKGFTSRRLKKSKKQK